MGVDHAQLHYGHEAGKQMKKRAEGQYAIAMVMLFGSIAAWVTAGVLALHQLSKTSREFSFTPTHAALRFSVIGAVAAGVLAIPISQYMPLFGSWINVLGRPWSPARMETIGIHFIGLSIIGGILCGVVAVAVKVANQR